MNWERIWIEYVGHGLFWGLHLVVGILALGWALGHVWVLLGIRKTAGTKEPVSEQDVNRFSARAQSYLPAYDYFSSAFVLTGLLGTIYGFFVALSADSRTFNTLAVSRALVTSGFGIAWALLTGLVSSLMERWCSRVPGWFPSVVTARDILDNAVGSLNQRLDAIAAGITGLTSSFQKVFEGGSKSFADASHDMAQAAQQLRESVEVAAGSFTLSIEEATKTSEQLETILNRTQELPAKVAETLEKFSEDHRNALDKTSRHIAARLDSTVQKFDDMLARSLEVPTKVGSALNEFSERYREALAAFNRELLDELHAATKSVATEVEKTKGIPAELAAEMRSAHEEYTRSVSQASEEQAKQVAVLINRVNEWIGYIKNLPTDIARSLADQQEEGLTKLNETTAKVWQETVRVLDDARDQLEKEADRLEEQRTELYKQETDRIRERFSGILQEVDKLAEGIRTRTLEAFTQGAGNIPGELRKFGTRIPELAAAVRDAAHETELATQEFRAQARSFSEEVTKLRALVEHSARLTPPPAPPDGQLLTALEHIEASITTIAKEGVTLRRRTPADRKSGQPESSWWAAVRSRLNFRRGR